METKLNIQSCLKAGAFAGLAAAAVNVILFFIFHALGIIVDDVVVQPNQPLTFMPVIFSTLIPSLVASFVFFLFEKYSNNGFRNFSILTIVLLLLSFGNPFLGIKGVPLDYAIVLCIMHSVVAGFVLFFIKRAKTTA